jgi:hypothetical protein
MVPRMRTPPLNSLPAIMVDTRRAMFSLTSDTAWGSLTCRVRVVVLLEADVQLCRSVPANAALGPLVRPGWRRG